MDVPGVLSLSDYLAIAGFAIVIWQIRRAGNLARAAKDAVREASTRSNIYALLLLAPQFEKCEAQLESAALQDDTTLLLERLREWRRLVAELRALLDDEYDDHKRVIAAIEHTLTHVSLAKKRALSTGPTNLLRNTEKLREAASDATSSVVTLAAQVKTNLDPSPRIGIAGSTDRGVGSSRQDPESRMSNNG